LIVNLKLRMGPGLAGIEIGSSWRQAVHRNEIGQFSAVGGMVDSRKKPSLDTRASKIRIPGREEYHHSPVSHICQ
jgi:hypothetical protein